MFRTHSLQMEITLTITSFLYLLQVMMQKITIWLFLIDGESVFLKPMKFISDGMEEIYERGKRPFLELTFGKLNLENQCLINADRKSTRLNSSHVRISYAV